MHASVRCGFTSRVRSAHLPLFIDFYFLFGFLCFINLFLGCARKRVVGFTSRVRFAHLPLFIDFYFLFEFLCFINLFFGSARKRAMWIHLTRSLRLPAVVHWLLFFIWVFMFYKFVFGLCTQACDVDSPHAFAPLTCRCSLTFIFYLGFYVL